MEKLLQIKSVTKVYNNGRGIQEASFECDPGEVVVFVGENGSGKSTLIKCIIGVVNGYSGEIRLGIVGNRCIDFNKGLGYVAEYAEFPNSMKVREYLELIAYIRNVDEALFDRTIAEELEYWGLTEYANDHIGKLSKGNRQKIAILQSYLHNPKLIIMDEPLSGLDFGVKEKVYEKIKQLGEQGKIIILSTHMVEELQGFYTKILLFYRGEIRKSIPVNQETIKRGAIGAIYTEVKEQMK